MSSLNRIVLPGQGKFLKLSGRSTSRLSMDMFGGTYASMSDANFGAYDRAKWAFSFFIRRASTDVGTNSMILQQDGGAGQRAFRILIDNNNKIDIKTYEDGTNAAGNIVTTATYTDVASYHHYLFHYDSANAAAGDRMRLWFDGTEVTAFDTDTNPTAAVFDSTADIKLGDTSASAQSTVAVIFDPIFFSGALPAVGSLRSSTGKSIAQLSEAGIYSWPIIATSGTVRDRVKGTNWTSNASGPLPCLTIP